MQLFNTIITMQIFNLQQRCIFTIVFIVVVIIISITLFYVDLDIIFTIM